MAGFVFSADWHLARLTWQHRPKVWGDSFYALEQIVDLCIQKRAALLAGGDLFDKDRPDSAAVACMAAQMTRMQEARLPVFYIQGQHEMASPPWLSAHGWPQHVNRQPFHVPDVGVCYGLDWCPREQFVAAMAEVSADTHMLMTHQVWMEHMGSVVTCPEANIQDVPMGVRVVLTGDYHQHQIVQHACRSDNKLLVSNGSISMRNLTEPPHKAVWYYDKGEFTSIALRGRPFVQQTIMNTSQIDDLHAMAWGHTAGLPEHIKMPICVLKYPADLPNAHRLISEKFADTALWLEEIRSEVLPQAVELPEWDERNGASLGTLIATSVPDGPDRTALLQLVESSARPAEAVRQWVEQNFPKLKGVDETRAVRSS